MAQTTGEDLPPIPQNPPSVERFSLPPGPSSIPEQNKLQGPVDPEIPLARPTVVPPRASPAKAPSPQPDPQSASPPPAPGATGVPERQAQPPVSKIPVRPEAAEEKSAAETDSAALNPVAAADEQPESIAVPAGTNLPPAKASAEPAPAAASNDWILLAFAALLVLLLGALFLWRVRRSPPKQPLATEPDTGGTGEKGLPAKIPEPLLPAPAITISFQPRSANATLINAVLNFELTLSNHGSDVLTDIRINGAMVQAKDGGSRDTVLADLSPLQEVQSLASGEDATIRTEFRIPLASIDPIMFQSQALFVPMVQIAMEYTDVTGVRQFQTAAFLVGREHQPPRHRMAPFRLDQGPRSYTPLGYRALTAS